MASPVPNHNTLGLGGEVGYLAREARPDVLARLEDLLTDDAPLNAGAALEAAETVLNGGVGRSLKVAAVSRLHALVRDQRVPPATSVRAARLLLSRCGRRPKNGGIT